MTVTDQIKILDRKIKQKESQYDLDREAAKISALSSKNLDKYELLTGEDLGLKPSTVEQAKFQYSPLGKIFNKGLSEEDKKEGLFKRLENIKDKNEKLINRFSTTNKAPKSKKITKSDVLTHNTKYSFVKLKNIDDIKKLPLDLLLNLMKEHYKKLNSLTDLKPRTRVNNNKRLEVLIHVGYIYNELYDIYRSKYNKEINSLSAKNKKKLDCKQLKISGDYWYPSDEKQEEQEEQEKQEKQEEKQEKQKEESEESKFLKYIKNKSEVINYVWFNYYFDFIQPSDLAKKLLEIKDKKKK